MVVMLRLVNSLSVFNSEKHHTVEKTGAYKMFGEKRLHDDVNIFDRNFLNVPNPCDCLNALSVNPIEVFIPRFLDPLLRGGVVYFEVFVDRDFNFSSLTEIAVRRSRLFLLS